MSNLTYKLKNINIDVDSTKDIQFPEMKDRTIEKYGDVVEFSLADIESADQQMLKTKKELEAKLFHEKAVMENIEHYHKFVKKLTDEQLLTAWMYQQAKGHVKLCTDNISKIDAQLESDKNEIAEILKQIPELALKKSADIVDEKVVLVEEPK